jgi:hypothetical protein
MSKAQEQSRPGAPRRAHSTPEPDDMPDRKPDPVPEPDDMPLPSHAPVQEPRMPAPPIKTRTPRTP